jgi:CheY-like chemotaxis protein
MASTGRKPALEMNALILCQDPQFLGMTSRVLKQLGATTASGDPDAAESFLAAQKYDAVVVDWQAIHDVAGFLGSVRKSTHNQDCVLVAIVRDLLDLRQAFAAGVHFLIHKPVTMKQAESCLRAAHSTFMARRRRYHREPVQISASISSRTLSLANVNIMNLSEGGAGLSLSRFGVSYPRVSAGDKVELSFTLPESSDSIHTTGVVVWNNAVGDAGVQFRFIPDSERTCLQRWLAGRFDKSLAELRVRVAQVGL